mmetsp:Transcript_28105/g.61062  ORF Transcript_28105/g.61062 Transcript_28105/m.61062 type:complete len:219 (-) Transcript_28105:203-859(-)
MLAGLPMDDRRTGLWSDWPSSTYGAKVRTWSCVSDSSTASRIWALILAVLDIVVSIRTLVLVVGIVLVRILARRLVLIGGGPGRFPRSPLPPRELRFNRLVALRDHVRRYLLALHNVVSRLLTVEGLFLGYSHRVEAGVHLVIVLERDSSFPRNLLQRGLFDVLIFVVRVVVDALHVVGQRLPKRAVQSDEPPLSSWLLRMLPFDDDGPTVDEVKTNF